MTKIALYIAIIFIIGSAAAVQHQETEDPDVILRRNYAT